MIIKYYNNKMSYDEVYMNRIDFTDNEESSENSSK